MNFTDLIAFVELSTGLHNWGRIRPSHLGCQSADGRFDYTKKLTSRTGDALGPHIWAARVQTEDLIIQKKNLQVAQTIKVLNDFILVLICPRSGWGKHALLQKMTIFYKFVVTTGFC